MQGLRIEFVETPSWRLPVEARAQQILTALAAVVLFGGVFVSVQWLQLDREIDEATRAIAVERRQLAARTPPPRPPLLLAEPQIVAINGIVGQLNTPWPALLDGFEGVATPDIALLQIEPDQRRRVVKGVAEAKTHQQMLDYLATLGSIAPFARAIVSKQEVNEKDPNRPLRFLFEALLHDSAAAGSQDADTGQAASSASSANAGVAE